MFTNYVWPKANLEFASLLYDIRHKKPAFDITEGIYYNGIDGYVIRVGEKSDDGQGLKDVLIYDHTKKTGNTHVIRAKSGRMAMSSDEQYLLFELYNGTSYEEIDGKANPHMQSSFEAEIMRFDLSGFQLERTDKDIFKDNYQMLNLRQLETAIDTHTTKLAKKREELNASVYNKTLRMGYEPEVKQAAISDSNLIAAYETFNKKFEVNFYETAISNLRQSKTSLLAKAEILKGSVRNINRHKIEWHRKFTLSCACIILFFIGAPLGAIIRKGGLGLPVVISVLFFLAYHITSITFEKLAKQGEMEAALGMWVASAVLLPIGFYLTYQATTDSKVLDMETYTKWIQWVKDRFMNPHSRKNANPIT